MYKKIEPNNKVFESAEFQKDKYKFNLILQNLSSEDLELYSDEKNYIICRGSKEWPAWIWTKDSFDVNRVSEIEELIKMYLTDKEKDKFTCKKELYDLLKERNFENLNLDDYFEMGFLICNKTKKTKDCDGVLSKPKENELEILAKNVYTFHKDAEGVDQITLEEAMNEVKPIFEEGKFYVLRNKENEIVCMGTYSVSQGQARISHVFTSLEERGKGYAAKLIHDLTEKLLDDGLQPLLYTDYSYKSSNKAYQNAGYEDQGILINFTCSKKK